MGINDLYLYSVVYTLMGHWCCMCEINQVLVFSLRDPNRERVLSQALQSRPLLRLHEFLLLYHGSLKFSSLNVKAGGATRLLGLPKKGVFCL